MRALVIPSLLVALFLALVATSGSGQTEISAGKVTSGPGRSFEPGLLTVPAGTLVRWVNVDADAHTITSTDSIEGDGEKPNGLFRGSIEGINDQWEYQFDEPGRYPYYCENHVTFGMEGQVMVGPEVTEAGSVSFAFVVLGLLGVSGAAVLCRRR